MKQPALPDPGLGRTRAALRARLRKIDHRGPSATAGDADALDPAALVPAAVLIALTDRAAPGLILTRRTSHLRRHAGQVAFPGGRIDATDRDATDAALREAEEEIGLDRAHVELVGPTDRYLTHSGFDITPVLAIVPPDLALTPHALEVDAIFEVPLEHVVNPANRVRRPYEWQGRTGHYYEIMWQEHRIWGVTAAMIVNLAARLGGAE